MQERNGFKRDFFRKNIFTMIGVVVFILILFVIIKPFNSKQSSNKELVNNLKQENMQLKKDNVHLTNENTIYKERTKSLSDRENMSRDDVKRIINKYDAIFTNLQDGIKNDSLSSLGLFSPEHAKKGDKVGGLTVSDIRNERANGINSVHIDFTGEFTVSGSIVRNETGNGYYFVVNDHFEKIPHTFHAYDGGMEQVTFTIPNENEMAKIDDIKNLSKSQSISVEAVFKNYSYKVVPVTDLGNCAEFVKLISKY